MKYGIKKLEMDVDIIRYFELSGRTYVAHERHTQSNAKTDAFSNSVVS